MYNWEAAEAFLNDKGLAEQHIKSFNDFIDNGLQRIIDEKGKIESHQEGVNVNLGKVRVERPRTIEADGSSPRVTPMRARLRDRTYSGKVFLELGLIEGDVERDMQEVYIGELPMMVQSRKCYLDGLSNEEMIEKGEDATDPGGYFIVNGSERVLVSVEEPAPNRAIVSQKTRSGKTSTITRAFSTRSGFRAKTQVKRKYDGTHYISFPASPKHLNIVTVLRALGLDTNEEIFNAFDESEKELIKNDLVLNIARTKPENTEDAIMHLGKRAASGQTEEYQLQRANYLLDNYLIPNDGVEEEDRIKKAYHICRMMEKGAKVAHGQRKEDDKDHYANKRLKLAGALMEDLFRHGLKYFVKDVRYQIDRVFSRSKKLRVRSLVRPDALTDRIQYGLATGEWPGGRTGVSQLLDRVNYTSVVSHLNRVVSPLSKVHPHFEARDLHSTHFGRICPNETPEGQSCGLVKNFAASAMVTATSPDTEELEEKLEKMGVTFKE